MAHSQYRVLISATSAPTQFLAELPFREVSFDEELNSAGSAHVSIPMRPYGTSTVVGFDADDITPGKTLLWIERDTRLLWGGIVWTVNGDVANNSIDIGVSGFHSYTRRRVIRQTLTYSGTDQLNIARDLIDKMEAVSGSLGLINTTEATTSGVTRTRNYRYWDRKNYGDAIEQLAAVNNGFDFRYEVAYSSGVPTVEFVTTYPNFGRRLPYIFALGSNAELMRISRDATSMANQADALGIGQGPKRLIASDSDATRLLTEPLLQAVDSFPDISGSGTLKAHATRRMKQGVQHEHYTVRLDPGGPPSVGSYEVGDIVELRGDYGLLNVSGDFRIARLGFRLGSEGELVVADLLSLNMFEQA